MNIVIATEKHRDYVISIIKIRWELSEDEANFEFDRWMKNDKKSICYVGLIDDSPMATGVVDFDRNEIIAQDMVPYNTLLYVEPNFRGHGYGNEMTKCRFEYVKNLGYNIIYLDTKDAKNYHLKFGWKIIKELEYDNDIYYIMNFFLYDNKLSFIQTKDIYQYGPILKPLVNDFSFVFYQTILLWCNVIPSIRPNNDLLWEIWLVKFDDKPIGICGLYTLTDAINTDELWLGWLGLLPELRNKNMGHQIMSHLYDYAKTFGCKKILSYVDKEGKPLNFYKKEGFQIIGTVGEYCEKNGIKNIDGDDFEDKDDFVIMKEI